MSSTGSNYNCNPSCGQGHFCGFDLECHPYSCKNWYEFANASMTDYDPTLPMSCEDQSQGDPEFAGLENAAVIFGWQWLAGKLPSLPEALYQRFTRKCSRADGEKESKFTCYEMASNSNFQSFVSSAESVNLAECEKPWDVQSYRINVIITRNDYVNGISSLEQLTSLGDATQKFNQTLAMGAMFADLTIKPITNSPSSQPSNHPTISNTGVHSSFTAGPIILIILGAFHIRHSFLWTTKE